MNIKIKIIEGFFSIFENIELLFPSDLDIGVFEKNFNDNKCYRELIRFFYYLPISTIKSVKYNGTVITIKEPNDNQDTKDIFFDILKNIFQTGEYKSDIIIELELNNTSLSGTPVTGGKKINKKEILGKVRCIYKKTGDRKEYIKHKGELITVSEYKKMMRDKKKIVVTPKPKPKAKPKAKSKPKARN